MISLVETVRGYFKPKETDELFISYLPVYDSLALPRQGKLPEEVRITMGNARRLKNCDEAGDHRLKAISNWAGLEERTEKLRKKYENHCRGGLALAAVSALAVIGNSYIISAVAGSDAREIVQHISKKDYFVEGLLAYGILTLFVGSVVHTVRSGTISSDIKAVEKYLGKILSKMVPEEPRPTNILPFSIR